MGSANGSLNPAVAAGNGSSDAATLKDFTAAIAVIASQPLSDTEKAEAVRVNFMKWTLVGSGC